MHIRKKWILTLCCVCLACVFGATAIGCSFGGVDNSSNLQAPKTKLQDVTGEYDVSKLASANFNDTVTTLDVAQTEISVIIDLGGKGLYDVYDNTQSFADFVSSSRAGKYLKTLTDQQNKVISALQKSGIEYTYRGSYTSVSNAIAVRINSADFYKLGKIEGVKQVYRNEIYSVPEAIDVVTNYTPVYSTGVYDSSESGYQGDGMLVAVLDTGLDYTHSAFQTMPDMNKTIWNRGKIASKFTESVALHSQSLGYSVDDVYVNDKVVYAFDYADDDSDVYPSYSNHGTHVAGIIAGQDEDKIVDEQGSTFIGVAPNAQLAIMKVFTDNLESKMLGGADTIDILNAIDDCAKLGVDVINMSLGSAGGFSDEKSDAYVTRVYEDIQKLGVSLIVAAGNEYSSGYGGGNGTNLASNPDSGTIGSPSSYEASLSVASIEGQKAPYIVGNQTTAETVAFITNSSDAYGNEMDFIELLYKAMEEKNGVTLDRSQPLEVPYVVIGGVGNLMNYTSSIRRQLRSAPTIALIRRGDISFADKVQYAMDNGAVACVIYNNLSGTIRMSLGDLVNPIPACSIGLEAGTNLVNNAVNGKGTLTISKDYTAGPFMSDFSSWGPTPSLRLKPEITAYGGKIMSAVPGGYDQLSGTSMASPNMAGMVALMRQHVSQTYGLSGADLNARVYQMLMSTTTMVNNDEGNPYSPRKQGAGLGSLQSALETLGYITVGDSAKTKIELWDDPERSGVYELEFTVRNLSNSGAISYMPRVYNMTETLAVDGRTVAEKSHMLTDTDVKVYVGGELTEGRITVPESSFVNVKVVLTLGDAGRKYIEDSFKNGMYVEGFVRLESGLDSSGNDICDIGVPYLAFYGDWADAPMFDYTVYEISENENDSSVELEDKIHASASATTPLGMFEDYYIIPLGSYVYTMEETDVAIDTSDERAAVSIFNGDYGPIRAINEFYGVYAGLLRGAKEMDISIVDTVTGETVFENMVYNQRKSYAGGGSNIGSPVTLDIRPFDWDWNNNTQYELKLTGRLDWTREGESTLVSPQKNEFSFKFTVDYEAPTITDYRVRFEPYTENRETKYRIYMDVDVYDNQYSMALMPCFIKEDASGDNTLYSMTRYPIPIYSQKNEVTTVSFEITDYYEDYFKTGNMFLYPMDYAMNHTLYRVTADEAVEYPDEVVFEEDGRLTKTRVETVGSGEDAYSYQVYRLTLAPNELYKLTEAAVLPEGTVNHKLTWTSSNPNVKAYEREIFAGPNVLNNVTLQLMSGDRIAAKISLIVRGDKQAEPRLRSVSFRPVFNGDNYVSAVGMSLPLNNNTQTKLEVEVDPWYYGDLDLIWATNNARIATVDENGVVSTHATGTAWISATCVDNPSIDVRVQVVVSSDYEVRNYRLYKYYGGEIAEIPNELNIMYLDDECFQDNTLVKKIVLPDTLTEIPQNAFVGCTNLEEVVIPASCVAILNNAFKDCTNLEKITLKHFENKVDHVETVGSLTIGIGAFQGCTSLTEIINPDRMTTLGDGAFYGCEGLTSVDLSGLRVAGTEVFAGCGNLQTVTMSAQTKLGRNMFLGCQKLNNLEIKASVLPYGVFAGCSGLTSVTFASDVVLKSIGAFAFSDCTNLVSVTLPDGEYSIGSDVFSGDTKLATVNLSANTHITDKLYTPFADCKALSAINVDAANPYYSSVDGVLYNKDKTEILLVPALARIDDSNIPDTVTRIGASAFAYNAYITSVDLSKYQSVGDYAFAGTGLVSATIPASWKQIPSGLFYGCDRLATVTFEEGALLEIVGEDAFGECSAITQITLPSSVNEIRHGAFMNCTRLSGLITLPNVERFGSYVFAGTKITAIEAPKSTTLDDFAFISMRSLIRVVLGPVTHMGEGIFLDVKRDAITNESGLVGNSSIQSVELADGTTEIGPYFLALGSVTGHLTEVVIPETVTKIGAYAFYGRAELTSVNLHGVKSVGAQAFMGCEKLAGLDLSTIETIGLAAFAYTEALKSADLSSAVSIGGSAFEKSGIETLKLSKIVSVDAFAFAETHVKTVEIPADFDSYTYNDVFYQINDSGDNEQVFGKKSLSLMGGAFMQISELTAFTVEQGNKVFFAEDGVLYARVKDGYVLVQYPSGKTVTEYEVLEGTVRIGDYAFYGDETLTKVTFPASLKSIGAFAFYNEDKLGKISREYVFKAVEAPVLESVYAVTNQYLEDNENNLVFSNYLSIFSTVYYANFGHFAALITEEDHVKTQIKWLKDEGQDTSSITYTAPTYSYTITRPVNGIGYGNPIWNAYFGTNVNETEYAAERITVAAIDAIGVINSADEIKQIVDGITDNAAKLAKLNEISENLLKPARQAYNLITNDGQKALVTEYGKLLASEKAIRDMKASLGVEVELVELRREGFYQSRYVEGDKFDPLNMQIVAVYADGSLVELPPETYVLDKPDGLKVSDTSVNVSYGGKSINLPIQVSAKPAPEPEKHTVTFSGDGVTTSTQTVNDGQKVSAPANPQREGYTFKFWAKQGETTAYDFDAAVTSDLTLVAVWEENAAPQKPVNVGLIVGLSVGGAVVAAGVATLAVLLLRKKKSASVNQSKSDETDKTDKAE